MSLVSYRLLLVLSAMVFGPATAGAVIVCDPDNARLFLTAGLIEDRRVQVGSRNIDTGVEAPKVVLDCIAVDGTTTDEKSCGEGVQDLFVTWHAAGGQVEIVCMPDTFSAPSTEPTITEPSSTSSEPGAEDDNSESSSEGVQN